MGLFGLADAVANGTNSTSHESHWEELVPSDPELRTAHMTYLLLGAFITFFGLVSHIVKDRLYMSEAMVAAAFGVIIGPIAGKLFVPEHLFGDSLHKTIFEVSRVVIALQCLIAGIALPGNYLWKEAKSVGMLLGPVMIYMWLSSALIVWAVFGFDWAFALILAGCVTPTDPVLANSIVKGKFAEKYIPYHVRLLISAESAANDGLGVPLVFLPLYLWRMAGAGKAIGYWLLNVVLYQIILAVVIGIAIGYASRKALKYADRHGWIDKEAMLGSFLAIALLSMGAMSLMGVDDILGCFVVGSVLSWDLWFNRHVDESNIQEIVDSIFNMTYFIFFGTLIPWMDFADVSIWKLVVASLLLLLFRRLPIVMLLKQWIPALETTKEAFFCGWFGPIGAGAIFYSMIAVVYLEMDPKPLFPIVAFIVLSSIVLHGGSVSLFEFGITRHTTWKQERRERKLQRTLSEEAKINSAAIVSETSISMPALETEPTLTNSPPMRPRAMSISKAVDTSDLHHAHAETDASADKPVDDAGPAAADETTDDAAAAGEPSNASGIASSGAGSKTVASQA
ncbi:Na+/H+ antiporter [Polyrhizophydium stewartii]|uniref:Na+/H+ antiporter n=1 Tax=Polyrhizophydium stewartii TaxID=2732419 RepID=A0ABR4NIE4_9FUNG